MDYQINELLDYRAKRRMDYG